MVFRKERFKSPTKRVIPDPIERMPVGKVKGAIEVRDRREWSMETEVEISTCDFYADLYESAPGGVLVNMLSP
jgi:hypothetical protein